jgi:all-trans-nonaprenyl-diphosphate synthase
MSEPALSMTSATSIFSPVEADLQQLTDNLKALVGGQNRYLAAAAEHLFGAGGKRVRPAIVLLVAKATVEGQEITPRHRRLAEITEMIHTASLVHDDVIDEADTRRGVATVHSIFGNRVAVLAGDFLFAQSSWYLANLDNLLVVKLLSKVIMDLAEGEIRQGLNRLDTGLTIEAYLDKSYYKTASLLANSAQAAAVLSDRSPEVQAQFYEYGRNLGLAFQIVDDILDFTGSSDSLGKPACSDLKSGNLTAPVLYALEEYALEDYDAAGQSALETLIVREFAQEGDLEQAIALVQNSQGIERSRQLAAHHAQAAVKQLVDLPASSAKQSLIDMADYVLSRLY